MIIDTRGATELQKRRAERWIRELYECVGCNYYSGLSAGCVKRNCTGVKKLKPKAKKKSFCSTCPYRNAEAGKCMICMMKILGRLPKELENAFCR